MRTFIGIRLDDCISEIKAIIDDLKREDNDARFTILSNIHITLEFLGEITLDQVEQIKDIFSSFEFSSFNLEVDKITNLRDMIILGVKENKDLKYIQNKLRNKLRESGFNVDSRKYYPHVTIARNSKNKITKDINLKSRIKELILFSSERINQDLVYTPILTKKLISI